MLIFTKGTTKSFLEVDKLLELLALNIGFCINKEKIIIFLSKGCTNKRSLVEAIGVAELLVSWHTSICKLFESKELFFLGGQVQEHGGRLDDF